MDFDAAVVEYLAARDAVGPAVVAARLERERVVHRFAADPESWSSPVNRVMSKMAAELLKLGVPCDEIYAAVEAVR